jgi:AcrR family transcriptional regulator/uncharacterized protein (DUF2249 family)
VESALAALGDMPIDRMSMRELARSQGISRRALLRHFRSRDEILAAVLVHAREELAGLAVKDVTSGEAPLAALERLARSIAAHGERNPGLPGLLLRTAAGGVDGPHRTAARQLLSMQRALAAEWLRQARAAGALGEGVDPTRASRLLVAVLQGLMLDWESGGRLGSLSERVDGALGFWRAGLRAGEPAGDATGRASADADEGGSGTRALIALDVRPLLAAGDDPLEEILGQLEQLAPDGVMKILAPFRPVPLLGLLKARGYDVRAREHGADCFCVEVLAREAPGIEDLRELEAPLPLERVLSATAGLAAGEALVARVPRHPRLLIPHLEARCLEYQVYDEPDGSALLHVRRPA